MAAAASARSDGDTERSASASRSLSGPFWVVFQSWMFSDVGFEHPGVAAADHASAHVNTAVVDRGKGQELAMRARMLDTR
ncbi:MAG TPA: hypothetical protein VH374_22005 [Polyangia bacterium]|nr:hypothetical protein [Polyangia bacterium]